MTFSKFNLGMFRQWFAEQPVDKIYTAGELAEMFEQACPLKIKKKDLEKIKCITFRHVFYKNEDGMIECRNCGLLKTTIFNNN